MKQLITVLSILFLFSCNSKKDNLKADVLTFFNQEAEKMQIPATFSDVEILSMDTLTELNVFMLKIDIEKSILDDYKKKMIDKMEHIKSSFGIAKRSISSVELNEHKIYVKQQVDELDSMRREFSHKLKLFNSLGSSALNADHKSVKYYSVKCLASFSDDKNSDTDTLYVYMTPDKEFMRREQILNQ